MQTFNVGHTSYIKSIIQISNEKIASCDQRGNIIIWNIENGDCLKIIEKHLDTIWHLVKLSSKKIISCSSDKTLKIWDIETGSCLSTLEGHKSLIYCINTF